MFCICHTTPTQNDSLCMSFVRLSHTIGRLLSACSQGKKFGIFPKGTATICYCMGSRTTVSQPFDYLPGALQLSYATATNIGLVCNTELVRKSCLTPCLVFSSDVKAKLQKLVQSSQSESNIAQEECYGISML